MSKKPTTTKVSKLKKIIDGGKEDKPARTNITLVVDAKLLSEGKKIFGRRMGAIFEAALEDAIEMKKGKKEGA